MVIFHHAKAVKIGRSVGRVFFRCHNDKMADTEPTVEPENTEENLKDTEEGEVLHDTEELTEDAQALKDELAKIVVHPPVIEA